MVKEVNVNVRMTRNGYYIRVWTSFWQVVPKRFVANTEEEVGQILSVVLSKEGLENEFR